MHYGRNAGKRRGDHYFLCGQYIINLNIYYNIIYKYTIVDIINDHINFFSKFVIQNPSLKKKTFKL